jgi:hypothetical protein
MLVSVKLDADFSREPAHSATRLRVSMTHPHRLINRVSTPANASLGKGERGR